MIKISISEIKTRKQLPGWMKVKAPTSQEFFEVQKLARGLKLHTVCEEAACPNIAECWKKKHATFMILGNICTRRCRFCNVKTGKPLEVDKEEPKNLAQAVKTLGLKHVVVTSVDRDDLVDGGANHFAEVIYAIRESSPEITIEVLTPDFLRKERAVDSIIKAKPDVFNHNLETVRRLFKSIKLGANYDVSLELLKYVKESNPTIFTKSGMIVGMGETNEEVLSSMDDLIASKVDFLTIGQYLKPRDLEVRYIDISRFVSPEEFKFFEEEAIKKGFKIASCSPLTRSSYHADENFQRLKNQAAQSNINS